MSAYMNCADIPKQPRKLVCNWQRGTIFAKSLQSTVLSTSDISPGNRIRRPWLFQRWLLGLPSGVKLDIQRVFLGARLVHWEHQRESAVIAEPLLGRSIFRSYRQT